MSSFITREFDFAIRICSFLAGYYKKSTVSLKRISKALYISPPFATKIVYRLRKKGVIGSVQGRNGGLFLNKDPRLLSVLDVLKAMGFKSTLNQCIVDHEICPLTTGCQIHQFFKQQNKILFDSFRNKMIADFAFTFADLPE
ncbi:MAG TPA: Rrf2 family transcriptional regulator [Calditrichaeota bacterium]|nr:Rrf2 family transcriptional regulator [Calditrichota bacterium]